MPRSGLDPATIIDRAARILDDPAVDGLSLTAVAESLGVRTPSLYKHLDGMPALQRGIMLRAKAELAHVLGQATIGCSRNDAITALSVAYRAWALDHPGQYPLTMRAPDPRDAEDLEVSSSALNVITTVLLSYDLLADDAVDATRFLRSTLHGFVDLETRGAFELPVDLERSFTRLVSSIAVALSTWSRS